MMRPFLFCIDTVALTFAVDVISGLIQGIQTI